VSLQQWPQLRDQILQRDDFTCFYCDFRAQKFQRVHFKNGIPAEPEPANLVTACVFCEQCCELESVAKMHSGLLIWFPEMPQTDLHHFCRALYAARMTENHPISQTAQRVMDQLLARRTEAKKRLGTDDPMILATAMIEQMDERTYAKREEKLDGIRLLPLPRRMAGTATADGANDQFPRIIEYWTSKEGPLASAPDDWLALAEKISA